MFGREEVKTADDVTSQDGLPGETLTYRLQVKNKGNYDETFTIIPTGTTAKWISDIPESILQRWHADLY